MPKRNRIALHVGQRFGRWEIVGGPRRSSNSRLLWLCKCDCGTEREVVQSDLSQGKSRSCGCILNEKRGWNLRTHGHYRDAEYNIWKCMHQRCDNPKNPSHRHYGGRNIKICTEWGSFEVFFADMGMRPSPQHTVGRLDNDGPYCKENCEWQLPHIQSRNTRRTRWVTIDGVKLCLKDGAAALGIPYGRVMTRVRRGWPIDLALSAPLRTAYRRSQKLNDFQP